MHPDTHSITTPGARGCSLLFPVPRSMLWFGLFFGGRAILLAFPSCLLSVSLAALRGCSSHSQPWGREVTTQEVFGRRDPTFDWFGGGGAGAPLLDGPLRNRPMPSKDTSGKSWAASVSCVPANDELWSSGNGSREGPLFCCCHFLGWHWAAAGAGMHLMWRMPELYSQKSSRRKTTPWPISHGASQDTH